MEEKRVNLEAEEICGYFVSSEMKKVWNVELEMLEMVDRICTENNIVYSLAGGSLLGAVRHKGYIPWDDDIDIVMLRKDYEKFLEIASKTFKNPFFLQYYKTEKKYPRGHAQIRNSNTTALIKGDEFNRFNKGIFIDIFPVDNVPDDEKIRDEFLKEVSRKKEKILFYYNIESKSKLKYYIKMVLRKLKYLIINYDNEIQNFENTLKKYLESDTKQCGAIGFRANEFKYDKKWFNDIIEVPFENTKVKIFSSYDEALKRQYGDYMKIPENKNGTVHGEVFFDTEKSYKEYEKKGEMKK